MGEVMDKDIEKIGLMMTGTPADEITEIQDKPRCLIPLQFRSRKNTSFRIPFGLSPGSPN